MLKFAVSASRIFRPNSAHLPKTYRSLYLSQGAECPYLLRSSEGLQHRFSTPCIGPANSGIHQASGIADSQKLRGQKVRAGVGSEADILATAAGGAASYRLAL